MSTCQAWHRRPKMVTWIKLRSSWESKGESRVVTDWESSRTVTLRESENLTLPLTTPLSRCVWRHCKKLVTMGFNYDKRRGDHPSLQWVCTFPYWICQPVYSLLRDDKVNVYFCRVPSVWLLQTRNLRQSRLEFRTRKSKDETLIHWKPYNMSGRPLVKGLETYTLYLYSSGISTIFLSYYTP